MRSGQIKSPRFGDNTPINISRDEMRQYDDTALKTYAALARQQHGEEEG